MAHIYFTAQMEYYESVLSPGQMRVLIILSVVITCVH